MAVSDPIMQGLMAEGAPFEVVAARASERDVRVFRHAPESLATLLNNARRFGEAEFIISGTRRLTYDDAFARADSLAAHLVGEMRVKPGQSVAICMKNSPEWMIGFMAAAFAGAVAVLVNSRGQGETLRAAIEDADCRLVLGDGPRLAKLSEAGCTVPQLSADAFEALPAPDGFTPVARTADDLAAMMFTSGTTGRAKAAALSHRALVTGVMNTQLAMAAVFAKMAKAYNIDPEVLKSQMPQGCSLLVFPLFHTSGCSAVFLTSMTSGSKLVLMDRWSAEGALELIEQEKVSTFGGVPTMYWDLFQSPDFETRDLSSLRSVSCGGQALPLNLLSEIRERFPEAFIGAGYGMTETCGAIAQANGEAFLKKPEASGQILPMVDVQIADDTGKALPIGEVGEIWAKGATLMDGYYGRPEETRSTMSGDWLKTGDVGRLDDEGYIYIVDRKTDMVISGGENIYCAEVEQVLGQHPDVLQVVTFGVPDARLGERLVASFVVKDGAVSKDILMAFAKDNLAAYKVPTDIRVQTTPFALNAMGKVEKQSLRASYLAAKNTQEAYNALS